MDTSSTTSSPESAGIDLESRNSGYSSEILRICLKRAESDRSSLFQAFVDFCEENDTDADDVYQWLDKTVKEQIKLSAMTSNAVRKCVAEAPDALEFE